MAAISNLLTMQGAMLVLFAAGFLLVKCGILTVPFRKSLMDLIIKFVMPCNIIRSFFIELDAQILKDCLAILLVSCGTQLFCILLGRLLYHQVEEGKRESLEYGIHTSNAGYLGMPLVEQLYGSQGLLYTSLYLIPVRIVMWSLGMACFSGTRGKGVLKKTLTHPCIIAAIIGIFLLVTQISLPGWLKKPLEMVSSCNTVLSLLVIGGVLAELNPKKVLNKQSVFYCLVRLVLLPLAVLGVCLLLKLEFLVTACSVVLAGMPAPLILAMLASQYNKDEQLAVSLIFLSTLLSMLTVPLLSLLISTIL